MKYLEIERGLKINSAGDGIYYVIGDIVTVQILEQKKLKSENNLFLRSLSSDADKEDIINIISLSERYEDLSDKSAYLVTLITANRKTVEEVLEMNTVIKDLFMEVAERNGWYKNRIEEKAIEIAKGMLLEGDSVEKVIRLTQLPIEIVIELQKHI